MSEQILAPLRGVTIRTFRRVFSKVICEAGFNSAITPFIPANPGMKFSRKVFNDILSVDEKEPYEIIPQVISKSPEALCEWCKAVKDLGFTRVDLNAGCPFPMVRGKGRGAGLLSTIAILDRMLEVGCTVMGENKFSLKTRLGINAPNELLAIMPIINRYPLAMLTVHARTAKQMYSGKPNVSAFAEILASTKLPLIYNGDAEIGVRPPLVCAGVMVGRSFIRSLGQRMDAHDLLKHYIEESECELTSSQPVLGRMKELLAYWREVPGRWQRLWPVIKICRSVDELKLIVN